MIAPLLERLFGATSHGGAGVALLAGLIVILRLLLPPEHRGSLRLPSLLGLLYLASIGTLASLRPGHPATGALSTISVLLFQLALARGVFLLIFRSPLGRGANQTPRIIQDIVQGLLYAGAILFLLRSVGVEPGSILTTSALLTAVLGLSLQETLGNLFAGLTLQIQVPFEVGDWIAIDDNPLLIGRVSEINWRATKIVTSEEVEITLPNGALAKANIRNFTKPSPVARRRVPFTCPHDVSPGRVREITLAAVASVSGVLRSPPPSVQPEQFSDDSVSYVLYFHIDKFERRIAIEGEVRVRLWYAFQRAGLRPSAGASSASPDELLAALRGVNILAVLPDEALATLVQRLERRLYGPNETVIRQGDPGQELFLIERGGVRILVGREGGSTAELTTLGPGGFFGEMSLMTGEHRTATAETSSESSLLVLSKEALQQVMTSHPGLAERIGEVLSARQEQLDEHLASRSQRRKPSEERKQELVDRIRRFFSL